MENLKFVAVGDGTVGKSATLISYTTNTFPDSYTPTVFDNYTCTLMVDGKPVMLALFDTAGQFEMDRLRPLSYGGADLFLVVFSVVDRNSFDNIRSAWVPEITHYSPKTPFLLVGNKCDLADDVRMQSKLIKDDEAHALAKELGAVCYISCSALTQKGLKEVFETAVRTVIERKAGEKGTQVKACCVIV